MIKYGSTNISKVVYNSTDCSKVIYNGTTVFTKATGPRIPAGTYYPSDFKTLLGKLGMSLGVRKEVAQGATVWCNGQSIYCSAFIEWARVGWYGSSGPQFICFDTVADSPYPGTFQQYRHYCVDRGIQPELNNYNNYSIRFETDLILK